MAYWRTANPQHDLLVHVTLGAQGIGPVILERLVPVGPPVPIGTPNPAMHVGAPVTFTISQAEQQAALAGMPPPLSLSLQIRSVAGNPGQQPVPIFHLVEQNGIPLAPEDDLANPLPVLAGGVELPPPLAFNVPGLWPFQVEY